MADFKKRQVERRRGRSDYLDPKKHYVRLNGWLPVFERYRKLTSNRVRYLTLCAKEAIDVRYFAQKGVLVRNEERNEYPFLTFVESDEEDYAIIAETLGRTMLGVHAKLEDVLLNDTHDQHRDLLESFPYDIINLDFCGEIMPKKEHPYSETVRTIEAIVDAQKRADAIRPWNLFVTFRTHRVQHSEEANDQLREIIEANLADAAAVSAYTPRPAPGDLMQSNYPEFLRLGIAKYLARTAETHGYEMTLDSTWRYGRHKGAYHIVKLVADFQPLTAPTALRNPAREREAYSRAVLRLFTSAARDVEEALQEAGAEAAIREDLTPVMDELEALAVVTAPGGDQKD